LVFCTVDYKGFFDELMEYYQKQGRNLPWRDSSNPYEIWVSEIILQQTRVNQGLQYFMTFLRYFPTIKSLAEAPRDQVLKVWEGLGYYSRAINMHLTAQQIMAKHGGEFPNTHDEIIALKGIGDYTAAAISSIAFGLPYAAVDGNVKRVFARIFNYDQPVDTNAAFSHIKKELTYAIQFYPPSMFNQAMMELGAMVCTPKNPSCAVCPMKVKCAAFASGQQEKLPIKTPKRKAVEEFRHYYHIEFDQKVLLCQRDDSSIWKGLWEFPNSISNSPDFNIESIGNLGITVDKLTVLHHTELLHKLTHKTIFAHFWYISGMPSIIVNQNLEVQAVPVSSLDTLALHRLMRKYLDHQEHKQLKETKDRT
jgi:A/G-specific adenine glycosylase